MKLALKCTPQEGCCLVSVGTACRACSPGLVTPTQALRSRSLISVLTPGVGVKLSASAVKLSMLQVCRQGGKAGVQAA